MASIAVVILNWNGERHLRQFLPDVCRHSEALADIVIADNGSTDASRRAVQELCPHAHWVSLGQNWGYAEGYNRALAWVRAHLRSDLYVLLNNDVEVHPGWLAPLAQRMERQAAIGALMPKILRWGSPGEFEYAGACGGFLDRYGYPYCRGRILDHVERDRGQYDAAMQVHWASGACLVVRSEVFWHVGGFAGHFFAHMEEIDLCWRIRRAGLQVWVEPAAVVYHVGGGTMGYADPRKLFLNHRNGFWMLQRNLTGCRRRILAMRLLIDCASSLYRLVRGRREEARAVLRALREALRAREQLVAIAPLRAGGDAAYAGLGRVRIVAGYYLWRRRFFYQLTRSRIMDE